MSGEPLNPKRIGAILSAYTGILIGDFTTYHKYIEELLGHDVNADDIGDLNLTVRVKALATDDFNLVNKWCGGK